MARQPQLLGVPRAWSWLGRALWDRIILIIPSVLLAESCFRPGCFPMGSQGGFMGQRALSWHRTRGTIPLEQDFLNALRSAGAEDIPVSSRALCNPSGQIKKDFIQAESRNVLDFPQKAPKAVTAPQGCSSLSLQAPKAHSHKTSTSNTPILTLNCQYELILCVFSCSKA